MRHKRLRQGCPSDVMIAAMKRVRNMWLIIWIGVALISATASILLSLWRVERTTPLTVHLQYISRALPLESLDVLEDPQGRLTIEQVSQPENAANFRTRKAPNLSLGQTQSVWWVRVMPPPGSEYLTVFNPTVQHATLYEPAPGKPGQFLDSSAGWGDPQSDRGESFIYPAFQLQAREPVYLRLSSIYLQSYSIRFYDAINFRLMAIRTLVVMALFFGMLLTIMVLHAVQSLESRDIVQWLYTLRILSTTIHLLALYGVFHFLGNPLGNVLVEHVATFSLLTSLFGLLFMSAYFQETAAEKLADWVALCAIAATAGIAFVSLWGIDYWVVFLGNSLTMLGMSAVIVLLAIAIRHRPLLNRHYQINLILATLFVVLNLLRLTGQMPNTEWMMFLLMGMLMLEAFVLSAGTAKKVRSLRKRAESSELAFLRAQIQPHFLYNTLSVMASIALRDGQKASNLLLDFAAFLRHSFNFHALEHEVPLVKEIEAIQAYARINEARFQKSLAIQFELDDISGLKIPALLLQPLVENAIVHGVRGREGDGLVIVRIKRFSKFYRVEVEDNGVGMDERLIRRLLSRQVEPGSGVGLANVMARLHSQYRRQLMIESIPDHGSKLWFELPIKD